MLCPFCHHLFLPKLNMEPGLAIVRQSRASRPKAIAVVRCPRCLYFVDGANRNTVTMEDVEAKT